MARRDVLVRLCADLNRRSGDHRWSWSVAPPTEYGDLTLLNALHVEIAWVAKKRAWMRSRGEFEHFQGSLEEAASMIFEASLREEQTRPRLKWAGHKFSKPDVRDRYFHKDWENLATSSKALTTKLMCCSLSQLVRSPAHNSQDVLVLCPDCGHGTLQNRRPDRCQCLCGWTYEGLA